MNNLMGGTAMQKLLISAGIAAFGFAMPACAGYISLNSPYDTGPAFAPVAGNMVEVSSPSWGGTVAGYGPTGVFPPPQAGSANFGSMDFVAGPAGPGNLYPANAANSLSFHSIIGVGVTEVIDDLQATITWNQVYISYMTVLTLLVLSSLAREQ
jgi:hypothetical protein